ncbi:hypothetical protein DA01_03595 [Dehalococcoides mccartyi]|uniref:Uncharacterized protein n=1 Tax=Dehalococcoides mccartyi TaxID=61435 RepID=A0A0V8LY60_9CHLR|nr:hypothetical protein [Dehalococcoides mccartyi]KSV16461.1 hypothetical protein DA01_03595 [Dehalococcoides mccartyi]
MKKFRMVIETEIEIEIEDVAFDIVNEDWKNCFFDLDGEEEIAKHIALNMVINDRKLSQLEGWYGLRGDNARITLKPDWAVPSIEEITK